MRVLVATSNRKKHEELRDILDGCGIELLSADDVGGLGDVEEDGETFAENAAKKAKAAAIEHSVWALADDSGLAVDSLGGAPGVLSARYSGPHAADEENNRKLLRELEGKPGSERGAHFICALALARPDGTIALTAEGRVEGRILDQARGANDFGYDPVFEFIEEGAGVAPGKSFAEMTRSEKAVVSHRGRAVRDFARRLPEILAGKHVPEEAPTRE